MKPSSQPQDKLAPRQATALSGSGHLRHDDACDRGGKTHVGERSERHRLALPCDRVSAHCGIAGAAVRGAKRS